MIKTEKKITELVAGAATTNITPLDPHFLFGYPHVERISEGVNDWLLSSALYLANGTNQILFISNDIIYINKASTARIRKEVFQKTGIPSCNIMISATHTHSGPITTDILSSLNDPVVPKVDIKYVHYMEDKIIESACNAFQNATSAKAGFLLADGTGVGTNRHSPTGPLDMEVPALVIKKTNNEFVACLLVCNMHPTILHENSKLYSGDFPAYAKEILQKKYLGCECPVIYFTGAAGNQSPRHVTKENTFEEAHRIGNIIAKAVGTKINEGLEYSSEVSILSLQKMVNLPKRQFPKLEFAEKNQKKCLERFEFLKKTSDNAPQIRTAEVDWFGSEELLSLTKLSEEGALEKVYKSCLPAEIQIFKIGSLCFVAWPGEIFIEYELELKKKRDNIFLMTLSNGELQGYMATKEAVDKGYYEASNSLFQYSAGNILVNETLNLLKTIE